MNAQQIELEIRRHIDNRFSAGMSRSEFLEKTRIPRMCFGDFELSIQASEHHYCSPREYVGRYDSVEIGFPDFDFSKEFIDKYAENPGEPQDTVYGYVPIGEIAKELSLLLSGGSN